MQVLRCVGSSFRPDVLGVGSAEQRTIKRCGMDKVWAGIGLGSCMRDTNATLVKNATLRELCIFQTPRKERTVRIRCTFLGVGPQNKVDNWGLD